MEEELFLQHRELSLSHWWFLGRSKVVEAVLGRYLPPDPGAILDIGPGYGGMAGLLTRYGSPEGLEPHTDAHPYLRQLGYAELYPDDFPEKFPAKKYGLVTMFDVLEHIKDDEKALEIVGAELLREQGFLVLTVPAFPGLWSRHDELNRHYRRYTLPELNRKARKAGFTPLKTTYFMSFLLPPALLARFLGGNRAPELSLPPALLNRILTGIFASEAFWLKNFNFPLGLSALGIYRR